MSDQPIYEGNRAELVASVGRRLFGERWQCDFARSSGISFNTVSRWIGGIRNMSDKTLMSLPNMIRREAESSEKRAADLRSFAAEIERQIRG